MTIGSDKLAAANAVFQRIFDEKYRPGVAEIMALCWGTTIPGKVGNYPFTTTAARMTQFDGEVAFRRIAADTITVLDKTWTDGLAIPEDILEDDQHDLVKGDIEDLAREGERYPEELIVAALLAAWSNLGYDKVPFISDAHPRRRGADQSNDLGGVDPSNDSFDDGVQILETLTDAEGRPRNGQVTHVVHGPATKALWRQILDVPTLTGGAANPNYQQAKRIQSAYITGKQSFLCDLGWSKRKPMLFQTRMPPRFTPPGAGSDHAQKYLEYLYMIKARFEVALMDPLTIVGMSGDNG